MSIYCTHHPDGVSKVRLGQRFGFDQRHPFMNTLNECIGYHPTHTLHIDCGAVTYIDTSGLAMLLIVRERALEKGKRIALTCCNAHVRRIMEIARFDELFSLN